MAKLIRFSFVLVGIALFVALFMARAAQASEVDRLLDLLVKKQVVTQEEAAALREEIDREKTSQKAQAVVEKQNQDAEKKEQPVTASSRIKLSGWVQTRYTNGVGTANPFEIRRARLALDGILSPKVGYKVQIDAVKSPVLLDARLDWNVSPYVRLTFGQFKIPFSQENLTSGRDLISIERSLVGLTLVPGRDTGNNGRDIGAMLAGSFLRNDGRPVFDYAFGLFNGAGINRRDDNGRKDAAGRLVIYPFAGLSLAGDYYNGASGPKEISRERAGAEFAFIHKLYSLRGEYIWGHDGAVHKRGWYSQFAYRFQEKWEGLLKFDNYDPDRRTPGDFTNTYLVGVNWFVAKGVKLQANYGLVDSKARTDLTNLFLTQLQYQF